MSFYRSFAFLFLLLPVGLLLAQPVQEYLPNQVTFNSKIPLPSETLGFEIGERHLRHDQLKQYFNTLAQNSTV